MGPRAATVIKEMTVACEQKGSHSTVSWRASALDNHICCAMQES